MTDIPLNSENLSRIKPVFKCPEEHKNIFKQSRCLLTISVGQEVHEGEKFSATIELVNDAFQECVILVDDTLQRHSMKFESHLTIEELYQVALEQGDLWMARSEPVYSKMTIPYKVLRWNKWLHHKNYNSVNSILRNIYEIDSQYRSQIDASVIQFLDRYFSRANKAVVTKDDAFQLCLDYLLEECTALCLWVEEGCQFEVYPSKRNSAMTETHERFVLPNYPDLLYPVAIKFKNRKQLKPQVFLSEEVAEAI